MCDRKYARAVVSQPCVLGGDSYTDRVRVEMRIAWPDHATAADIDLAYQQALRELRADYARAVKEITPCPRQAS